MQNYYVLQDLWVYDLSGNEITRQDREMAIKHNLLMKVFYGADECVIIGSYNSILNYLFDYIGIEPVTDYLKPLKDVL